MCFHFCILCKGGYKCLLQSQADLISGEIKALYVKYNRKMLLRKNASLGISPDLRSTCTNLPLTLTNNLRTIFFGKQNDAKLIRSTSK